MGTAATILLAFAFLGQDPSTSAQVARQRPAGSSPAASASETAALRQSIDALTRQVTLLRQQFADQQTNDMRRFNANVARLQLVQADIDRMKKERTDVQQRLYAAQAKVDDANDRLNNIQRELSNTTDINRGDAENRLRAAFNRQLTTGQSEVNDLSTQLTVLEDRITRAERVADTFRRRLKIDDSQIDVDDEPAPARPSSDDAPPSPQER